MTLLKASNVVKRFGKFTALDGDGVNIEDINFAKISVMTAIAPMLIVMAL